MSLIEVLIAIILIGVVIIAIGNIELFSRFHVAASEKRVKLQNDVSYVIDHLTKTLIGSAATGGAIGDILRPTVSIAGNAIRIWVDLNRNGRRDSPPDDVEVVYSYQPDTHQVWYYPNFSTNPGVHDVLTNSVILPGFGSDTTQPSYFLYDPNNNYLDVQISACWNPAGTPPNICNTQENPQVTMQSRIQMPSVSTH